MSWFLLSIPTNHGENTEQELYFRSLVLIASTVIWEPVCDMIIWISKEFKDHNIVNNLVLVFVSLHSISENLHWLQICMINSSTFNLALSKDRIADITNGIVALLGKSFRCRIPSLHIGQPEPENRPVGGRRSALPVVVNDGKQQQCMDGWRQGMCNGVHANRAPGQRILMASTCLPAMEAVSWADCRTDEDDDYYRLQRQQKTRLGSSAPIFLWGYTPRRDEQWHWLLDNSSSRRRRRWCPREEEIATLKMSTRSRRDDESEFLSGEEWLRGGASEERI